MGNNKSVYKGALFCQRLRLSMKRRVFHLKKRGQRIGCRFRRVMSWYVRPALAVSVLLLLLIAAVAHYSIATPQAIAEVGPPIPSYDEAGGKRFTASDPMELL